MSPCVCAFCASRTFLRDVFCTPIPHAASGRVPAPSIYDIVKEERGISSEMALRLAYAFGTTPDFWLNLQSAFNLRVARNQKKRSLGVKFASDGDGLKPGWKPPRAFAVQTGLRGFRKAENPHVSDET